MHSTAKADLIFVWFRRWVAAFHNFTQVKASSEHVREADSAEPQRSFSMPSASGLQKFRSDSSAAAPVPEEGGPHLINEKTAEHLVDLVTKMTVVRHCNCSAG